MDDLIAYFVKKSEKTKFFFFTAKICYNSYGGYNDLHTPF